MVGEALVATARLSITAKATIYFGIYETAERQLSQSLIDRRAEGLF
jgi:hypothetical protein